MEYSDKRAELIDWIAETVTDFSDNPKYTVEQLEKMNGARLLGIWLEWEGIQGYTGSIIETVEQAFGVDLEERRFLQDDTPKRQSKRRSKMNHFSDDGCNYTEEDMGYDSKPIGGFSDE